MIFAINKTTDWFYLKYRQGYFRIAERISSIAQKNNVKAYLGKISKVEHIALFTAQNYRRAIKVADVRSKVGLHPDYANVIFKKFLV